MAESKTTRGRKSTENEGDEVVQHGVMDEETLKQTFVQKVNGGDFTFNETQVRAMAAALGVEDEVDNAVLGQREESPTAGLTPATGSGGVPYTPDAATDETKKAAKDAKKRLDKGEYPDNSSVSPQRVADKALAGAVPDKS